MKPTTRAASLFALCTTWASLAAAESQPSKEPTPEQTAKPAAGDRAEVSTTPASASKSERLPRTTDGLCAEMCDGDEAFHRSTVGFGVALGISQIYEIDGINHRLALAGVDELSEVGAHVSFSIPMTIERFVLLTQIRFLRLGAPGDDTRLNTYLGTFSFGYSLTPPEHLALYPFAGLGVGAAELTVGRPGPVGANFDQALAQTRGGVDLSTIAFLGTVGVAADLLLARSADHPTRGVFLGARTGFTAGLLHSDWSLGPEEGDVADGPPAPMSGFYGEFAFGLRF